MEGLYRIFVLVRNITLLPIATEDNDAQPIYAPTWIPLLLTLGSANLASRTGLFLM